MCYASRGYEDGLSANAALLVTAGYEAISGLLEIS
jgi:hypothetical protein